MTWTIEILDETVEEELKALPRDLLAKFYRIVELIESEGLQNIREPYVKHLENKLWEMRMKGKDGIARAIYVTATGKRVVVIRAFVKKTQQTPLNELKIARKRAKEV